MVVMTVISVWTVLSSLSSYLGSVESHPLHSDSVRLICYTQPSRRVRVESFRLDGTLYFYNMFHRREYVYKSPTLSDRYLFSSLLIVRTVEDTSS